ncbi:MAG: MBL fold metallo-hydrolase [Halioglobus sp.]|nr:MBL fold metallo-hydrolase [Halioglobus sp.]
MIRYLFEDLPEAGEVREIRPGILWLRMPLPMASLNHINLYLLEDDDGWWIVDTGIGIGDTETIWESVFARHLGDKPVKAVLSTHYHPDHTGVAGWLCERWRAPFYMSQAEYFTGMTFSRTTNEHFTWMSQQYLAQCGFDDQQIEDMGGRFGGMGEVMRPLPTAYRRLVDGGHLRINGVDWEVMVGRGHSPEHACLYCASHNILISGDQVIPRITSNISVGGSEPEANPLKEWFSSLERFLDELPHDTLVLPAHNAPFHGLHTRLRYLIDHHEDHLLALEEACVEEGHTALELLPVLFKRELDEHNLGLALGECLAHLNYLHQRGQVARELDEKGAYRYRSIDETLALRRRQRHHDAQGDAPMQV